MSYKGKIYIDIDDKEIIELVELLYIFKGMLHHKLAEHQRVVDKAKKKGEPENVVKTYEVAVNALTCRMNEVEKFILYFVGKRKESEHFEYLNLLDESR